MSKDILIIYNGRNVFKNNLTECAVKGMYFAVEEHNEKCYKVISNHLKGITLPKKYCEVQEFNKEE
jgi:hypothetical protein